MIVYRSDGKAVGHIDGDTYHTKRKRSVHMLRQPQAWAIDRAILYRLTDADVLRVVVHETEAGQTYTARLADFWKHGIRVNRGHGEQIALPLAWWSVDGRRAEADAQAERAAVKSAQLALFGEVGQ